MELKMDWKAFAKAVKFASKTLPKGNIKPELKGFIFDSRKLMTTDLDRSTVVEMEAEVTEEGKFMLPAEPILNLAKLNYNEIAFKQTSENAVEVVTDKGRYKLHTMEIPELPAFEIPKGTNITLNTTDFLDAVRSVIYAAAKDPYVRNLWGVCFEASDGNLTIVATDGFRLAKQELEVEVDGTFQFICPRHAVEAMLTILEETSEAFVNLMYDGRKLAFKVDGITFITHLVNEAFPNYKHVISTVPKTRVKLNKSELLLCVRSALVVGGYILFEIDGSFQVSAQSPEKGEFASEIDAEIEGDGIVIGFNPAFIHDALKHIEDEDITLEFAGTDKPCFIQKNHVVMPVRLS